MTIWNYDFANPQFFWLLILLPVMVFWYIRQQKKQVQRQKLPTLNAFQGMKTGFRPFLYHGLFGMFALAYILLIIALARPQTSYNNKKITTQGINIVIALDTSPSMMAKDFKPNRLEAAKEVAMNFISGRPNDRIGLVIFAGESFTQSPTTIDHAMLKKLMKSVKSGELSNGTAIGMGLATAVDRLKDSKAKSKVVILLTDGENNTGFIAPMTAAQIAKKFGIRVYTIGIGSQGYAPITVTDQFGNKHTEKVPVQIDENLLRKIAKLTGGKYFRATNDKSLYDIYNEINKMEKTKIQVAVTQRKVDHYRIFALLAGILIFFELLFRYTIFRMLP